MKSVRCVCVQHGAEANRRRGSKQGEQRQQAQIHEQEGIATLCVLRLLGAMMTIGIHHVSEKRKLLPESSNVVNHSAKRNKNGNLQHPKLKIVGSTRYDTRKTSPLPPQPPHARTTRTQNKPTHTSTQRALEKARPRLGGITAACNGSPERSFRRTLPREPRQSIPGRASGSWK